MSLYEVVDYSQTGASGPPGSQALTDAGQEGAIRYLAVDARGADRGELTELRGGGKVYGFVYEEGDHSWQEGFAGGVRQSTAAQFRLVALGQPLTIPVYFTVDWDAAPEDQAVINDFFRGVASVIGLGRTGAYAGYYVLNRIKQAGVATFFWQTRAWSYTLSGVLLQMPGAHLFQYGFGHDINGTDCDDNHVYIANWGQITMYDGSQPTPPPPAPKPAKGYAKPHPTTQEGLSVIRYAKNLTVIKAYTPREVASDKGAPTGAEVPVINPKTGKPNVVQAYWLRTAADGTIWYETKGGSRHPRWAFFEEPPKAKV